MKILKFSPLAYTGTVMLGGRMNAFNNDNPNTILTACPGVLSAFAGTNYYGIGVSSLPGFPGAAFTELELDLCRYVSIVVMNANPSGYTSYAKKLDGVIVTDPTPYAIGANVDATLDNALAYWNGKAGFKAAKLHADTTGAIAISCVQPFLWGTYGSGMNVSGAHHTPIDIANQRYSEKTLARVAELAFSRN